MLWRTLDFHYDGEISSFNGLNIEIKDLTPNENIIKCLEYNKEKAIIKLSEPLYEIKESLWHDVLEENPITNFLSDALREILNCEIGIIKSGILNRGIKKGAVTKKKLLEICPSPLSPTNISFYRI